MANIKISELSPLVTVQDADVLPIVDNAITKKVTAAILRSYTEGNSVLLTGAQTIAGIKTFTAQLASSVATGTAPFSVASTTKVTNLNADLLDGLSSADFQATLSGTGIVKSTAGTISYLTDNSGNWNTAFNDKINSAAVTGSGTNTLTLTQQDAGTITATWVNGTLIREIRNNTGATLTKGTIVYISGATGNKPTVTKAIATGDSTSAQTFGFVQNDILNNAEGFVVVIGDLIGLDTSAFTEGDQLYLSSTVAGAFTDVKQYAPNHLVYVGIVTRSHPTLGQIEVNIQNGYEMDELHNVSAQNPSNGDILQFVTSTGLWTKVAGSTTNISEGTNLYYTAARFNSAFAGKTTTDLTEGTNLYFTNARARGAISLTTSGTSGAATYNSSTGVLNIPNYADTDTGITSLNGLTALTQTFAVGTSGTDFGISSATSTHTFNLPTASATNRGALSSADWTTFNNKATTADLANYLPLAGGTLTGALNGTSGTFSGNLDSSGKYAATSNQTSPSDGSAYFYKSSSGAVVSGYQFITETGGAGSRGTRLTIDNTGAATFSSSVTTGGNLSVGGSNQDSLLTINGTAGTSHSRFREGSTTVGFVGGADGLISGQAGKLAVRGEAGLVLSGQGNAPDLVITSGNVGIGTTTPAFNGTDSGLQILKSSVAATLRLTSSTSNFDIANDSAGVYQIVRSNDSLYFGTNNIIRFSIASSGAATFSSSVTTGGSLTIGSGGNYATGSIYSDAGWGMIFRAKQASPTIAEFMWANSADSELMRIKSNGNVLIGTTTDAGYKLDINGTARVSGTLRTTGNAWIYDTTQDRQILIGEGSRDVNIAGATSAATNTLIGFSNVGGNNRLSLYEDKLLIASTGTATFSGQVNIGNPVAAAVAVASTHKVEIVIGGTTYYLLATT
jgi:hypothetical protein